MPLTINTNMAASTCEPFPSKEHRRPATRAWTGSPAESVSTSASDDAGGLAVSMKLRARSILLKAAANNVANAISFLQVQDGTT